MAWLKEQVRNGTLTELSTCATAVASGLIDAYGVSAENVSIDDVGNYDEREWTPSDIAFGASSPGPNVLCLHDSVTPYRSGAAVDVHLDQLLAKSRVSFDCVLVGDEHRPKNEDLEDGYTFEAGDGTPVFYTGPAMQISEPYRNREGFVTELRITADGVSAKRHAL